MPSPYDNETYLLSLAQSRGDVDRQVQNALSEIGRQRDVNVGQAGRVPGATGQVFDAGQSRYTEGMGQIGSALQQALGSNQDPRFSMYQRPMSPSFRGAGIPMQDKGSRFGGLGSLARPNLATRPGTGALPQEQAAFLQALGSQRQGFNQAGGLLQQGFQEQATQRTGSANNIAAQIRADLDAKTQEYVSRREGEDRQRAFEQQQAEIARQHAAQLAQEEAARQQGYLAQQAAQAQAQMAFEAQQAAAQRAHLSMLANPPAPAQSARPQQVVGIRDNRRPVSGAY